MWPCNFTLAGISDLSRIRILSVHLGFITVFVPPHQPCSPRPQPSVPVDLKLALSNDKHTLDPLGNAFGAYKLRKEDGNRLGRKLFHGLFNSVSVYEPAKAELGDSASGPNGMLSKLVGSTAPHGPHPCEPVLQLQVMQVPENQLRC